MLSETMRFVAHVLKKPQRKQCRLNRGGSSTCGKKTSFPAGREGLSAAQTPCEKAAIAA